MILRSLVESLIKASKIQSLIAAFVLGVSAGPADLDSSFGQGGKITTAINFAKGYDTAVQQDGKIVVVGNSLQGNDLLMAIVRYTSDGTLDPSFGINGTVTAAFGGGYPLALVIQPNGRIVVAGFSCPTLSDCDFTVARFNTDGSVDDSFQGGRVTVDFGARDTALDITIQEDQKLVVAGSSGTNGGNDSRFAVARLRSDGTLDPTFDDDGKTTTTVSELSVYAASAVTAMPSGQIVVAGRSGGGNEPTRFAVVRYNSNGSLDTSFDLDGKVTTDAGPGDDGAESVLIQPDGKIVAAGYYSNGIAAVRYLANGSLDTSFDKDGIVNASGGAAFCAALQSDGKLIFGGLSGSNGSNFMISRFLENGLPDTSFGTGGIRETSFGKAGYSSIRALAIQPDGRIVAAGYYDGEDAFSLIAVARYLTSNSTLTNVSLGGRVASSEGRGVANAQVTLKNASGQVRYARTNPFGYYRFTGVTTEQSYSLDVSSKRYMFIVRPRTIFVTEVVGSSDFFAEASFVSN